MPAKYCISKFDILSIQIMGRYWISKLQPDNRNWICISKVQSDIEHPNPSWILNIQIPATYWISKFQSDIQPDIQPDIGCSNFSHISSQIDWKLQLLNFIIIFCAICYINHNALYPLNCILLFSDQWHPLIIYSKYLLCSNFPAS